MEPESDVRPDFDWQIAIKAAFDQLRAGGDLLNVVRNDVDGNKYFVSTVQKRPLPVWETAIIEAQHTGPDFMSGFSPRNFRFVKETFDTMMRNPTGIAIIRAHIKAWQMATYDDPATWRMSLAQINQLQIDAADRL